MNVLTLNKWYIKLKDWYFKMPTFYIAIRCELFKGIRHD